MDKAYDGPPPAGIELLPRRDVVAADLVEQLASFFEHATRGNDAAWHISSGLSALQNATARRDAARISGCQRDRLVSMLINIRPVLMQIFPAAPDREMVRRGAEAAAGLIIWWSESKDIRQARHPHVHTDLHAYARILRNRCHDLSLLVEIERRASDRIAETVRGVLEKAVA